MGRHEAHILIHGVPVLLVMGSNEKYAMICAFLDWYGVSRCDTYQDRIIFVPAKIEIYLYSYWDFVKLFVVFV